MIKQEILNQIDSAIELAPISEPFEYVSEYDEDGNKYRKCDVEPEQKSVHYEKIYRSQGQVTFKTGTKSFKVINDKEYLKKFKKEIEKNWKAKKINLVKVTPLSSIKSCILRLIKDLKHKQEDSDLYHLNIFSADELYPGNVFYGHGAVYINPYIIDSELSVTGRNLIVTNGIGGWEVLDKLTAMSILGSSNKPANNKLSVIKIAKQNCENYNFDKQVIKHAELTNTQVKLKERYCELNNIEVPELSFL